MSRGRPAVEVEGLRQLRRTLKAAGVSLQDLKDEHQKVADFVVRASAPRAPHRTGRLAATVRGSGTQSGAVVRLGRAAVPYAGPIYWGWEAHHIKANQWVTEAATDTQEQWARMYLSALEHIIDSIEGAPGP